MKKSLLILLFAWFFIGTVNAQIPGTSLKIITVHPSGILTVCMDSTQFKIILQNDTTVSIDSIYIEHRLHAGVYYTGTLSGADSVNSSNPNHPLFFISSLVPGAKDTIVFSIKASCDFLKDTSKVSDTTIVCYTSGSNHYTQLPVSSSYNINSAVISFYDDKNNNEPVKPKDWNFRVGQNSTRIFQVINTNGAIDSFTIKINLEPELELDTLQASDKATPLNYTVSGNVITISIDKQFIASYGANVSNWDSDSLFEQNEVITIIEQATVRSCSQDTTSAYQTHYTASWGCGGQACESVSTNANVQVKTGAPTVTCSNYSNPKLTSFGSPDTGTTVFAFTNIGSDAKDDINSLPFGSGMATNIQFTLSYNQTAAEILGIRINNIPLASIAGITIDTAGTSYTIKLNSVTDTRLNIADADGDGSFDDLYVKDTFFVAVDYKLHCTADITEKFYKDIYFINIHPIYYSDMCGKQTISNGTDQSNIRYANIWGNNSTAVAPADLQANQIATFTFCPEFRQSWYGGQFYFNCPDDSYYAVLSLPKGYRLTTYPNPDTLFFKYKYKNDSIRVSAIQRNDSTIILQIGKLDKDISSWVTVRQYIGYFGCFDIKLQLVCVKKLPVTFGYDTLKLNVYHSCDTTSPKCDDWLAYTSVETYFHCIGDCSFPVNTKSFTAERATFGWVEPPAGTFYTETTRNAATRITRAMADTKGIKLNAAYPADSVLMIIPGSIDTISTPLDCVMVEISYIAQKNALTNKAIFDFVGGSFEITDTSTHNTIVCNVSSEHVDSIVVAGDMIIHHYVFIPRSCSFASGDSLLFRGYFKVKQNSIDAGFYDIPKLRAQYMAITRNHDTLHSCDPWGANFSIYQPTANFYPYGISNTACKEYFAGFHVFEKEGLSAIGREDFPHEFRNYIKLTDTITFILPSGYEFKGDSAEFQRDGYPTGKKASPKKIISTTGNDTIIFVEDWPVFDFKDASQHAQSLVIGVKSSCSVPDDANVLASGGFIVNKHTLDSSSYITQRGQVSIRYYNYKPALAITPPPTQDVKNSILKTDFMLCNNSTTSEAPYTWMAFENPSSNQKLLYLLRKKSIGNGYDTLKGSYNADSSKLFVKTDTLFPNGIFCKNYTLVAKNTKCDTITTNDSIAVYTGWQCGGFPFNRDSASCPSDTSLFRYNILPAALDFKVTVPPDSIPLCDTARYTITILNPKLSTLNNVKLWVDVSKSMELGSVKAHYPASHADTLLPQPTSGYGTNGTLSGWDLNHILLGDTGLVGDTAKNKILLDISFSPVCGYDPNQFITFYCSGINPCGDFIQQNFQSRLQLAALLPSDSLNMNMTSSTDTLGCNKILVINVQVFNTGDTTKKSNRLQLSIPYPFDPLPLSVFPPFYTVDTTVKGKKTLSWMLPKMLHGETASFTAMLILTDTVCNPLTVSAQVDALDTLPCIAKAISCPISSLVASANTSINACCRTQCVLNAGFKADTLCVGSQFSFKPDTLVSTWTHQWLFGDSTTASTDSIAKHVYSTAGTYTVTHIVSNSCGSDTAKHTMLVEPNPTMSISGKAGICKGDSTTLTASGAMSYLWNTGATATSIAVSPNTTTTYTVKGTNNNGCSTSDSVEVAVHTLPVITISGNLSVCAGSSTILTASGANTYTWTPATGLSCTNCANPTLTPTTATTYTITGVDTNGCSANTSIQDTVNPLPTVTITASGAATTFCSGDSVLLTASAAASYNWSNGKTTQSIVVKTTGNYSVTITDAKGCKQTAKDSIIVNPLPNVTLTPFKPVCVNLPRKDLTGGFPTGGTYSGKGVSGQLFEPRVAGVGTHPITYSYTDSNGCSGSATQTIQVDAQPAKATITPNTTICHPGDEVTLTVSGSGTYSWSTGETTASITVNPIQNTTYTVDITNACGTAKKKVDITVDCIKNPSCGNYYEELGDPKTTTTLTGKTFLKGKTYHIIGDLIFSGGYFEVQAGAKLYIEGDGKAFNTQFPPISLSTLSNNRRSILTGPSIYLANQCTLQVNTEAEIRAACNQMWGGIISQGATSQNRVIMNGATIKHSAKGIVLKGGGLDHFEITNCDFRNNYVCISVSGNSDYQPYSPADSITGNTFSSLPEDMLKPLNKVGNNIFYTHTAIQLTHNNISIDISANQISNCLLGISTWEKTSFEAVNNTFTNNFLAGIYRFSGAGGTLDMAKVTGNTFNFPNNSSIQNSDLPWPSVIKKKGIGILSFGAGMTVSGTNRFNPNKITGTDQEGIVVLDRLPSNLIRDNEFYNLKNGVHELNLSSTDSKIESNLFESTDAGVLIGNNSGSTPNLQIHCNSFDKGTSTIATGISVDAGGFLNEQGGCNFPDVPAGNKFDVNMTSIANDVSNTTPLRYNRYFNEFISSVGPVIITRCTTVADANTCPGTIGAGKMASEPDINQLIADLKGNKLSVNEQRETIAAIIKYYHKNKQCGNELEKLTDDILSVNKLAYNAFSWHLVDCYAEKNDAGKTLDRKDKVLKNNAKDDDMKMRDRFYNLLFKIEHLTTSPSYQITEDDIEELVEISKSGSSFSLTACYMLLPLAPDKVDCFDSKDVKGSYKMSTETENTESNYTEAMLGDNVPNPFNDKTVIKYFVPENTQNATMIISDVMGNTKQVYPQLPKGASEISVSTKDLSTGIYFYKLLIDERIIAVKKMVVIK